MSFSHSPSSGAARHLLPVGEKGKAGVNGAGSSAAPLSGKLLAGTPVPANIEPFVRVLGVDKAIEFLLEFGGAELYIARRPQERGRLAQLIGPVKASELAQAAEHLPRRIPLAKAWIARTLLTRDVPVAEIARRLRVSDVTVRKMTIAEREDRQLSFF